MERMRILPALLVVLLAACGNASADARAKAESDALAALDKDPSQALHLARGALAEFGPDARLSLVAGLACLRLDRRDEAILDAETGLADESASADLHADLSWVRGAALMARYRDLSADRDWRAANMSLENATEAGSHRLEAATALTFLQALGKLGTDDRLLRFAKLVFELAPDGPEATQVHALLDKKGLKP